MREAVDQDTGHTPDEERRNREAALDETIEASFPASDPPSTDPNPDDPDAARRHPDTVPPLPARRHKA
jgi:hypothetical protein